MKNSTINTILNNQILILKILQIQNNKRIDDLSNRVDNRQDLIASKDECEMVHRMDLSNDLYKAISNTMVEIEKENMYD